jgi:hypothetical protein
LSIDPLVIIPSTRPYQKLCKNKRYILKKDIQEEEEDLMMIKPCQNK